MDPNVHATTAPCAGRKRARLLILIEGCPSITDLYLSIQVLTVDTENNISPNRRKFSSWPQQPAPARRSCHALYLVGCILFLVFN